MKVLLPLLLSCIVVSIGATTGPGADPKEDAVDGRDHILRQFTEEFVALTPGEGKFPASFRMGSIGAEEKPAHTVTFRKSFAVARYEVTQELYEAVMGRNPSRWKGP